MSGAAWRADSAGVTLPLRDYVLSYEACRAAGSDFFGTVTFPVLKPDQHLTLVLGGWGGGLVGLSNIDHLDASENATRSEMTFNNDVWYAVRIEVSVDEIFVTLAPVVFGGRKAPTMTGLPGPFFTSPREFRVVSQEVAGDECYLHFRRRKKSRD